MEETRASSAVALTESLQSTFQGVLFHCETNWEDMIKLQKDISPLFCRVTLVLCKVSYNTMQKVTKKTTTSALDSDRL